MPRITSFRPSTRVSIDQRVQSGNVESPTAGIESRTIAQASGAASNLLTDLVEREKNFRAKSRTMDNSNAMQETMSEAYSFAKNNYKPGVGVVRYARDEQGAVRVDSNGNAIVDEVLADNMNQYLDQESEIFSLKVPEPESLTEDRLWSTRRKEINNKFQIDAVTETMRINKVYASDKVDKDAETRNKQIERKQETLKIEDVEDAILSNVESVASLSDYMDVNERQKKLDLNNNKTAVMGVDTFLDSGKLNLAEQALLIPVDSADAGSARAEALTNSYRKIVNKYTGGDFKRREELPDGSVVYRDTNNMAVLIDPTGSVTVKDLTKNPGMEQVFTEALDAGVTLKKRSSVVFDNLSDTDYARLLDRFTSETLNAKKETSKRAMLQQRGMVAMMTDPNRDTRKIPNFKNPDDPNTIAFFDNIELIQGSIDDEAQKEAMISEMYAAYAAGSTYNKLDKANPSEARNLINSLDAISTGLMEKEGIFVPESMKAITNIKSRNILERYEADRQKRNQSPDYVRQVDTRTDNLFQQALQKGGSFDKYVDRLNSVRNRMGVSTFNNTFPEAYTKGIADELNSLGEAGTSGAIAAQAMVKELKVKAGASFPKLWKEITANGAGSDFSLLGMLPSTVEGDRAGATTFSNFYNEKAITQGLKDSTDEYNLLSKDLTASVSSVLQPYKSYYSVAQGLSGSQGTINSLSKAVRLEASKILQGKEDINDIDVINSAVKEAKDRILTRNFISDQAVGSNQQVIVDKGLLQQNQITEDEARAMIRVYSKEENIADNVGLEVMSSSRLKEDLRQLFPSEKDPIKKLFTDGDLGEVVPVFTSEGMALRMVPSNGALPFYILNNEGTFLMIPFDEAKRDNKVIEEAKGFIEKADNIADDLVNTINTEVDQPKSYGNRRYK